MKVVAILVMLGLILGGCSSQMVYKGVKRTEKYPAKYEYRCVEKVCKEVNTNYSVELIPKDEYKHLSKEELKNKQKKFNDIKSNISGSIFLGITAISGIAIGISTGINVGGGNRSCCRYRSRSFSYTYYWNYIIYWSI